MWTWSANDRQMRLAVDTLQISTFQSVEATQGTSFIGLSNAIHSRVRTVLLV